MPNGIIFHQPIFPWNFRGPISLTFHHHHLGGPKWVVLFGRYKLIWPDSMDSSLVALQSTNIATWILNPWVWKFEPPKKFPPKNKGPRGWNLTPISGGSSNAISPFSDIFSMKYIDSFRVHFPASYVSLPERMNRDSRRLQHLTVLVASCYC